MDDVYQLLKIALMCLADDPSARPSMADVVDMLVRAQENAQKIKKDPRLRDILSQVVSVIYVLYDCFMSKTTKVKGNVVLQCGWQ